MHRGASDSGSPAGKRNGHYRHGERTKAAFAEQRKFSALLKLLRVTAFAMPILKCASRVVVLTVEGGAAVPTPTGEQPCRYLQLNEVPAKPLTVGLDGPPDG